MHPPRLILPPLLLALAGAASLLAVAPPPDRVPPEVRNLVAALEKELPAYENAADDAEKALKPFLGSADPKKAVAADSALLQVQAIRSVRAIIAQQPGYLRYHIGPANLPRWKEGAEYFLACAREGKDPFAGMTKGTRPFRSRIDGQLLLYHFTLPQGYDPEKKYPLKVHLHAGGGFTWLAYWVTGKPDSSPRSAAADGAIHITPAGRQHVGTGEVAVLEAIAAAKKHLAVDPDRVIIGGASWGGTGGFHFGTLVPDHFAGAYSLTGGGNYAVPVGNGLFDAYLLGDNLCNLPFLIWDTPGDGHYRANHAFANGLRERARKYPGSYPHLELTDPRGGHGIIDRKLQDEGWAWLMKQSRVRFPRRVVYKTYGLRYDGAYWARIDTVQDPSRPARIEAEADGEGGVRVALDNADRFHLDLGPSLAGKAKEVVVRIGGEGITVPVGKTAYFWKKGDRWASSGQRYPAGLVKKHGLSGPIQDVFMDRPVLLVYGTAQERTAEAAHGMLDGVVARLFGPRDGGGFLHSGFPRKADSAVTAADLADKDLVLVGSARENRLVAKVADRLPVTFLEDGVKVGAKEYRGEGVGLVMVYPNPLNPEHYVLLIPEGYAGGRPWPYPDYVVLRAPRGGKGNAAVLAQGIFDARWQLP